VHTIWAVACAASISGLLLLLAGGCAGPTSEVKDFNRLEVGEGPGAVMKQLIELQKKPGHSVPTPPPVEPTPAPHIASANPPAQESTAPPHDIHMSSSTMIERAPTSDPAPGKMTPSPVAASPKPPAPVPTKKEREPVAASDKSPMSPPPKDTKASVIAPIEAPAPATSTREPMTVIASAQPAATPETAPAPSSPVPSSPPPTAKPTVDDNSGGPKYRIGPEDILHIDVWGNPELTRDAIVRPDGKISLPLIQDIRAEGRTATELSDVIHQRLLEFIKDPEVAVIVTAINAPKIFVIGYVARPGPYPLRGDMSVLQALSLAGGFTPFASPKKIKVLRDNGGKRETRKINYYDMIDEGEKGNYLLKPGDTIVVP